MGTAAVTDLRRLDDAFAGLAKLSCELKPDHIFLIGNSRDLETIAAEIATRNAKIASVGPGGLVQAQQQTGQGRAAGATGSTLRGEVIGVSPHGALSIKTSLDHDLPDLCDLLRRF